jgi:hypothetical protein
VPPAGGRLATLKSASSLEMGFERKIAERQRRWIMKQWPEFEAQMRPTAGRRSGSQRPSAASGKTSRSRDSSYLRRVSVPPEFPGADLVRTGIADLERGVESVEALLVSIGAPRLAELGLPIRQPFPEPEHRLYELLSRDDPDDAHSRYNALVRRLVSFERAAECAA